MSIEINADLFKKLNASNQFQANSTTLGGNGVSVKKIDQIQLQLGFELPGDFRFFLENLEDTLNIFFDWKNFDLAAYDASIEWISDGIEFDIENNQQNWRH